MSPEPPPPAASPPSALPVVVDINRGDTARAQSRLLRAGAAGMTAMAVLSSLGGALNYVSSSVFSRILEPVGFGELTSLLALAVVLAVPLGAAQTIVAERISLAHAAGDPERVRYLVRYAIGHVTAVGLAATAVYVACIPLVMATLQIREPGPVVAVAPLILVMFVTPVALGVLQGLERYTAFGLVIVATAASRLLFGVPWAATGGGAGGAIAGQAVGLLMVLLVVGWRQRELLIGRGSGAARGGFRRRPDMLTLTASGAFIGFALLSNLDLVLVRLWLDGDQAGVYAAVATVTKVVIFLPAAVSVIMVPRVARAHAGDGSSLAVLRSSALIVLAIALLAGIPGAVVPAQVVDLMFGGAYDEAVPGVVPAVLAGTFLALLYLVCVYSVTIRDRRWFLLLVAGVALQAGLIALFHGSPTEVMWAQAATVGLVLVANELAFHSLLPRRRVRLA